jgi:hypothetical protein
MAFIRRAFLGLFGAAPVVLKAWEVGAPEPSAPSAPALPERTVSYPQANWDCAVTAFEYVDCTVSYYPTSVLKP